MRISNLDLKLVRRCIELSKKSVKNGDAPFGALIAKDGKVLVEVCNNAKNRVSDHAEVVALDKAHKLLKTSNLSEYTLYSNCEPCPMCAFMAREYKVSRVVFALPSPFMGGYSKWSILKDKDLSQFIPYFGNPPKIISGILETEAKKVFDKAGLWMFGSDAKETEKKD